MYLDHTVGELVEYLTTNGWMENSIIVVASDNGGCPSLGGSNYPLRGLKHTYWEGGVKVHVNDERCSAVVLVLLRLMLVLWALRKMPLLFLSGRVCSLQS